MARAIREPAAGTVVLHPSAVSPGRHPHAAGRLRRNGARLLAGVRTQTSGSPEINVAGPRRQFPWSRSSTRRRAAWRRSGSPAPRPRHVIVLNGVQAIPDAMDFSETVSAEQDREIDSTAGWNRDRKSTGNASAMNHPQWHHAACLGIRAHARHRSGRRRIPGKPRSHVFP